MPLLSPADQQTLRESFAAISRPVTILFFSQAVGCETCAETAQILAEITQLTDKVTVEEISLVLEKDRATQYGIDRVPAVVLLGGDAREDSRIRFLGAPEGWDFLSLVDALLLVSGGSPQHLSQATLTALETVSEPLSLQVFVTPT
jgi:alkyl hydroperoxide reductase subunit AhpF